ATRRTPGGECVTASRSRSTASRTWSSTACSGSGGSRPATTACNDRCSPEVLPTYDLHQHIWPPALIDALRKRTTRPRLRGAELQLPHGDWRIDLSTHDLAARLAALDRDGIDVAVVSCPA